MYDALKQPDVAIIDYGVGNLLSVRRALEHCGANVSVSATAADILASSRVILPGVGAFADAMAQLRQRGLDAVTREVAARGTPLMGICLGMQMLLDESEEFGITAGLGLIPGRVIPVPAVAADGSRQKIPHIGWASLHPPRADASWSGTALRTTSPSEAFYFVHSFMAHPSSAAHRVADCIYGGNPVSAAIGRERIFGCQFHPEKSGASGLKLLRAFLAQDNEQPPVR